MSRIEPFSELAAAGLNLQAVVDLDSLPADWRMALDPARRFSRLLLVGHGGRLLWAQLVAARARGEWPGAHPIDDYSVATVRRWLAAHYPAAMSEFVYPHPLDRPAVVDLQRLGALVGWHHPAPFMVGINAVWGPWFAYRVLVLTDAPLLPTRPLVDASPCGSCTGRPCVGACPAGAMNDGVFALARCVRYRAQEGSVCALTCQAREACPVHAEHRYDADQLAHCYGESLRMLRAWLGGVGEKEKQ